MLSLATCGGQAAKNTADTGDAKQSSGQKDKINKQLTKSFSAIEKEGMQVIVQPVHLRKNVNDEFTIDIMKKGFMPVYLKASNDAYEGQVVCNPENIKLISTMGEAVSPVSAEFVFDKVKRSYAEAIAVGVMLGGLGAAANAAAVASANSDMEQALANKALRKKTLDVGESVDGYVYMPVPNELFSLDDWKIVATINNPGHKVFEFEQTLSGKTDYRGKKPLYVLKKEMARKKAQEKQQ